MTKTNFVRVISKLAPPEGATDSRSVRFVLSTVAEDRVGDTIDPKGWKLDNYKRNPVVLWGHDQYFPPIGKMSDVRVDAAGALVGTVEFATAEQHPFADTIYRLVKGGFINAGSVGFVPIRWEFKDDGGIDFREQELLEYSVVTVPANPQALVTARAAGVDLEPIAKALAGRPDDAFASFRKALFDKSAGEVAPPPEAPAAVAPLGPLRLRVAKSRLAILE